MAGGVILASARHQMRVIVTAWKIPAVLGIIQPAVLLIVTVGTARHLAPGGASRLAIGVLLTASWSFTVWTGAGILQQDRRDGTLAGCVIAVRDFRLVVAGKSLGVSALSSLVVATTVATTLALMRQPVRFDSPALLLAGLVAVLISALVLGTGLSCVFLLSRFGPQISGALMYPIFLLAGFLTPLSALPRALQVLSAGISLRWAMRFLTGTIDGRFDGLAFGMLVGLTCGYALAGGYAFERVAAIVRREGTMELV